MHENYTLNMQLLALLILTNMAACKEHVRLMRSPDAFALSRITRSVFDCVLKLCGNDVHQNLHFMFRTCAKANGL